jgi:CRISPR-associated protein Csx10
MRAFFFPYVISLHAPVVMTGRGHRVYSASTMKYISGSAIRGAVAARLGDPDGQDEPSRERFHHLVLSGRVRYGNAYPGARDGSERSVPVPLSFKKRKHEEGDFSYVFDLLAGGVEDALVDPEFSFAVIGSNEVYPAIVKLGARVHHRRGQGQPSPSGGDGRPFTYQYIRGGQAFVGHLTVDADSDNEAKAIAQEIGHLLKGNLLLGRSKGAGYGGNAKLRLNLQPERGVSFGGIWSDIEAGGKFCVLLLSDFLGRDDCTGMVDPSSFQAHLEKALETNLCQLGACAGTGYAGGYNTKARMALPAVRALTKGSIFLFQTEAGLDARRLVQIQNSGLGMRRAEGYGEIVFLNAPSVPVYRLNSQSVVPKDDVTVEKDSRSEEILSFMQERILLDELNKEIRRWTRELVKGEAFVSPSLLGRLRQAMRSEPGEALKAFRRWLGENRGRKAGHTSSATLRSKALRQLQDCKLGRITLDRWLRHVINDPDYVLKNLNSQQLCNDFQLVSHEHATKVLGGLTDQIRCAVIDSVLAEISRHARLSERGGKRG